MTTTSAMTVLDNRITLRSRSDIVAIRYARGAEAKIGNIVAQSTSPHTMPKQLPLPGEQFTLYAIPPQFVRSQPEPAVLVIEDVHALGSRRGKRVTSLLVEISDLSRKRGVGVRLIGRLDMLRAFSRDGRTSKDDVARAIAARFPELSSRLPDRRKAWEAEAERLGIFDAIAFGEAFYEGRFSA